MTENITAEIVTTARLSAGERSSIETGMSAQPLVMTPWRGEGRG